jgi:hypothetical protein
MTLNRNECIRCKKKKKLFSETSFFPSRESRHVTEVTRETLPKIYDSCKIQRQLETANIFTPTRHILKTSQRVCQVEGIHGLPQVGAPTFFPKTSKNKDTWWETKTQESLTTRTP